MNTEVLTFLSLILLFFISNQTFGQSDSTANLRPQGFMAELSLVGKAKSLTEDRKFSEAEAILKQAKQMHAERGGQPDMSAFGIANIQGMNYYQWEKYQPAIESFHEALKLADATGFLKMKFKRNACHQLGIAYSAVGDRKNQLKYHQQALEFLLQMPVPDNPALAETYSQIGVSYQYLANDRLAIEFHEKSLDLNLKTGGEESYQVAKDLMNIGSCYVSLGDIKQGIVFLKKAYRIFQRVSKWHLDPDS